MSLSNSQSLLQKPFFRYLTPFIFFMLMTEFQKFFEGAHLFGIYGVKAVLTGLLLLFLFRGKTFEISGRFDLNAVFLGLVVLVLWILPAKILYTGLPASFDPAVIEAPMSKIAALSARIFGAVCIVPIMEELLWRSFLMRYLIQKDFLNVPLGTYSPASFWVTVIAFTLVHQSWEWPMAFVTGILYGGYLVKTKNLWGCITAHAVTNLGLAIYVIATKSWWFW